MASESKSAITFIKFLVFEFTSEFKIPTLFVKRYEKIIPRLCTLRSNLGKSCEVSVVRNNKGHLFFRKGWDKFLKENELKEGDILVFNLVDDTTFEVLAYGPTCCLKKVPQEPLFQIPSTSQGKKVSSKPGPSARNTECGEAKRGRKQKEPYSHDQNKFEYGNAKLGRKVLEERDDDKPVAKQPKSDKQLHSHSVVLTLKEYHKHNVALPRGFTSKAMLKHRNKIEIEYPEGRTWTILIWLRKEHAFLSTGWADFVKANGLIPGDTCVLHTVQDKVNFFTAEVYRSGTSSIREVQTQ